MKSFAVVCAVLVAFVVLGAASPGEWEAKLKGIAGECMKDHNVKLEDFERIRNAGVKAKDEDVSNDMKCAIHCVTMKMGAMDENGKMKPDNIKPMLNDEQKAKFEEAYKECNEITGGNACETALLTFACMMEHHMG